MSNKYALYFFTVFFLFFGSVIAEEEIPKLTLNGRAVLHKSADQMSLNIGVTTIGKEAENVLKENSQKMQNVIRELEKSGLSKSEMQTDQFSIQPTYTPYPKNPPPDWKPSINGYEVNNTIIIRTEKIKQIGSFIDAASRAGANKIDQIQQGMKDERIHKQEAIVLATKNALEDARIMADAAEVKLLRLLSISLDDAQLRPPQPLSPMFFKAAAGTESTPIESGEVEIKANVIVVFEIGK